MEDGSLADTTTTSGVRRGVRHLTFMDLPGEIRNNTYEHYGYTDRGRLFNSASSRRPRSELDKKEKKGAFFFLVRKKENFYFVSLRSTQNRHLLFFTPSIARINRQIRREYLSLILAQATLLLDIASEPHIWDHFVQTIGEDVIKTIAALEIRNLSAGCGFEDFGHVSVFVSLHNVLVPVTWNSGDYGHSCDQQRKGNGGLAMQLRAANKINRTVRKIQVEDGKRSLSKESLRAVLGYATLEKVHSDVAWLNRATQYCVMALWAVITLPVLMLSLLIRGGPATFVLPVVITVVFGCMIMGFHVLDWAPDGVEFLLECWDAEREKSDEIKYGKESLEGVN